jgi:chitinase
MLLTRKIFGTIMLIAATFLLTNCSSDSGQQSPVLTIVSLSPTNNATQVLIDTNLVITFSKEVFAGDGSVIIKNSSDNSTKELIDVSGDQLTGFGSDTITIKPVSILECATDYYVLITDTAFTDEAGFYFEGIDDMETWAFSTELEKLTSKIRAGYTYYRGDNADFTLFRDAIIHGYNSIQICFASLYSDGSIKFDNEYQQNISQKAYDYAKENNIEVFLTFGGQGGVFSLKNDNNPEDIILNYLNNLCGDERKGICYDGVNLDIEGDQVKGQADPTSLNNIVKIATKLRDNGYKVVIAPEYPYVIPVTTLWPEWKHTPTIYPQDAPNIYRTLLENDLIDYAFVQLYNQPGLDSKAYGTEAYICKNSLNCTGGSPDDDFVYENDPGFIKAFQTNMIEYWKGSIDLTQKLVHGFPSSDGAYGDVAADPPYWAGMDYAPQIFDELKTLSPIPKGLAIWSINSDAQADGSSFPLDKQWHSVNGSVKTFYDKSKWEFIEIIKKDF